MMQFQVYVLDQWGTALHQLELECATVEEAKQRAAQLVEDHPVELWHGPVRIARFTPTED